MNEITKALTEAVSDACERHPSVTEAGGEVEWNAELWNALEQIGVTLLSVPEEAGGAGGDMSMAVAVLQVLGEQSAGVPFAETALLGAWLLSESGAPIPDGVLTAAVAEPDVTLIEEPGGSWTLDGALSRVPWARYADHIVLLVDGNVVLVERQRASVTPGSNMAGEPRDRVEFNRVAVDTVFTPVDDAGVSPQAFAARGALARTASMAGAARRALDLSVRYASERQQFGRPVKAFQAVQQLLATLAGETLLCGVAAESAAQALDVDPGSLLPIAAAKTSASKSAGEVASVAHQVHGAIGVTDEHELRLSTTRLWAWREEFGSARAWAKQVGEIGAKAGADGLWAALVNGR